MKVGTFNRTGAVYSGHLDPWLTNRLQVLTENTQHLVPDSTPLLGWVNGDLYTPAGETVGILPIPEPTRAAADLQSFNPLADNQMKQVFLARQQGTKYAVISVHTTDEKVLFKKLMQEDTSNGAKPNWKLAAKRWNQNANGKTIFYKVSYGLLIYS